MTDTPDRPIIQVSQLAERGLGRREIEAHVKGLQRLAVGRYADVRGLDARNVHRLHVEALIQRVGGASASHTSGACLLGLPVRLSDLEVVHLSPLAERAGHPKRGRGYRFHWAEVPSSDLVEVAGIPTTNPIRTIIDCARSLDPDWGVVVADAALHSRLVSQAALESRCSMTRNLTGSRRVRALPGRFSAKAESPGESLLRLRLARLGFDAQEQVVLRDVAGEPRVDFLIAGLLVVEFDGESKYTLEGDPARAHWLEKQRHDRIVEAGYEAIHVTWAQLWDESALQARIARGRERARRRVA